MQGVTIIIPPHLFWSLLSQLLETEIKFRRYSWLALRVHWPPTTASTQRTCEFLFWRMEATPEQGIHQHHICHKYTDCNINCKGAKELASQSSTRFCIRCCTLSCPWIMKSKLLYNISNIIMLFNNILECIYIYRVWKLKWKLKILAGLGGVPSCLGPMAEKLTHREEP